MRATLVILGTALSLQDADHVYSAIAKPTNFSRITEFPQFDDNDGPSLIVLNMDLVDDLTSRSMRRRIILDSTPATTVNQMAYGASPSRISFSLFNSTGFWLRASLCSLLVMADRGMPSIHNCNRIRIDFVSWFNVRATTP
ncbi:MAG: hypothetical protein J3R72DRAFT_423531 [Linnemannia gamsii]|nr:MAG: hypothetical protein J3R72DRAFT_423531 [Linnemannia gamsii]